MGMIKAYCNDFWRYRYLLYNLIGRDFKLKYRRSVLGVVWSVLNPLLMCLVMWVVFSTVFDMRGGDIVNFPVYLMIGQLLFNFFNEATNTAMSSMLSAATLIKKVYIPKYIFPLEKVCFSLVNCLFSFIALIIVMLFTGAELHTTVLQCLYPLLTLFVFSLGIGLVLAALTVFFRDIMHLWGVFTTALMYFSAIFYDPLAMNNAFLTQFIKFNPLYWYITAFRYTVLFGKPLTFSMIWICAACAIVALTLGLIFFRRQQDKFVLYI
ncbi:MAG: ABC transporter permease [Clostridia bacterium]|jgi:ABC-2 type transport system permease protein|nr:ABC transporter permease [Clostridia bacterium]NLS85798.1 ABC transporter permease [Oscillospiraceae bacterium]